jgi:DNA (cytosine-5)-methyltransferase 1
MIYGSVCSGIEAATVAWHPLGWKAAWLSEIEPFPSAALKHHYPNTTNLGDMRHIARQILQGDVVAPDVLVGGTPCQAFSVAGLREGLDDERGQLTLSYVRLFDAIDYVRGRSGREPAICVWENVPGVLSDKTNAFGCLLAGLAGEDVELKPAGKKWTNAGCVFGPKRAVAWRVLDAQYFGVAQRRRRVFVVASARKGFNPAEVLFEFNGVRRDTPPSRSAGQGAAADASYGISSDCFDRSGEGAGGTPGERSGLGIVEGISPTIRAKRPNAVAFGGNNTSGSIEAATALNANRGCHNPGDFEAGTLLVQSTIGFNARQDPDSWIDRTGPLDTYGSTQAVAQAVHENQRAELTLNDTAGAIKCAGGKPGQGYPAALIGMSVRRLTPVECERLQGFPDGYTSIPTYNGWRKMDPSETPESCRAEGLDIKQNPKTGKWRVKNVDGPRYTALGNSMAVPCMRWIGERIARAVHGIPQ